MKQVFWMLLLLAVPSELMAQIEFPPLPPPPPLTLPDCPERFMGKANGIWYWVTQTCTTPLLSGFGQSGREMQTGCAGEVCIDPIMLVATHVLQSEQKDNDVEARGFRLTACGLSQDTPAELDEKLKAILEESRQLDRYLLRLEQSPDELTVDHVQRIQCWRAYLCCLIAYLEDTSPGADSPEKKIANYCTSTPDRRSVLETYRQHEAAWSTTFVDGISGRGFLLDRMQKGPLVSADMVVIEKAPGFIVIDNGVYEVTVGRLRPNRQDDNEADTAKKDNVPEYASKTVYFRTFTFQKANDPRVYSPVGIQVSDPGRYKPRPAKITNRNTFGHLIQASPGSAFFLVSSVDDLSIAP